MCLSDFTPIEVFFNQAVRVYKGAHGDCKAI